MILILFITSLMINSNAQCTTGISSTTSHGPMTVRATLCSADDNVYMNITYNQYNNNWFAISFPSNPSQSGMVGVVFAYSTGKTTDALPAAVYAYTTTAQNVNGVSQPDTSIWTKISETINNNNAQVIYKTPLTNMPFDINTVTIPFSYASGSANTLALAYHNNNRVSTRTTGLKLQFPTDLPTVSPTSQSNNPTASPSQPPTITTINPTVPPTKSPNNIPTLSPTNNPLTGSPIASPTVSPVSAEFELCATAELISGVKLEMRRKESDQTVEITISGPEEKWMAFGFGENVMEGWCICRQDHII
eukprot:128666_1